MSAIPAAHVAGISDIGDVEWEQTLEMLLHIFITF